ncbi:MAG: DUF5668 domain-containing protein [Paludibacter sp.]
MPVKKDNRLAWGITLLFFGCLFLIKQMHILPDSFEPYIFDFKNYPLFMGIIFLLFNSNRTAGIVLIVVGLLFRLSEIIQITRHISDFVWPVLLIIAGGILIFGSKKGKW